MENSAHYFETAEQLAEKLARSALDIEERAWEVMEHGTTAVKAELMTKVVKTLKGSWAHSQRETNWRASLLFEYKEFCVEQGIIKPDQGDLPVPDKADANTPMQEEAPEKPKKPKKPAKKKE